MKAWITIEVNVHSLAKADAIAVRVSKDLHGAVIQVDQRPPQGSLIVGDMREDG